MRFPKIWQIARREFLATVMTKGFLIGLLAMPVMLGAMILIMPLLIQNKSPKLEGTVLVIDTRGDVAATLATQLSPEAFAERRIAMQKRMDAVMPSAVRGLTGGSTEAALQQGMDQALGEVPQLELVPTNEDALESAKAQLAKPGNVLALLVIHEDAVMPAPGAEPLALGAYDLFVRNKLDDRLLDELREAAKNALVEARLAARSLNADEIRLLTQVPRIVPRKIGAGGVERAHEIAGKALPMGFMLLILIAVMTAGQQLLTSTIEEKSSRVVELLLAAVSPTELMAGKVLGQLGVGSLMMALYAGLGLFALASFAAMGLVEPHMLVFLGIFFLIAFVTIAALMAAIGAAVNELREAQALMTPLIVLIMLPMMLWLPISRDPNSLFATVLSLTPPVSPFVMILRMTSSSPPPDWQVWLSILLGLIAVAGCLWFAGKVFRIGLLMHGKPPNMVTLWRWARMS